MEIPLFLFLGMISTALALAFFGFLRQPQIPAMLAFGGMFVLFIAVSTTSIILDDNITTSIERVISPSNWFLAEDNTVGVFNGMNSFAQASDNTVYNITTGDYWYVGVFNTTTDGGASKTLVRKMGGGTTAGYGAFITSTGQFQCIARDGTNSVSTFTTNMQVLSDNYYVYGCLGDRSNNLSALLYNLDTGILRVQSTSMVSLVGSMSSTNIFTIGRDSAGSSGFFTGFKDMIIPPQNGLLTQSQFLGFATTGNLSELSTFNNIYLFENNLNDSIGSNNLTNNNVGFLFTSSQSFTEIENTVTSAVFEFTALPKTLFALLGVIFMLSGALMIFRGPVD